jgi:Xaa-Pro aminopeptidase
VLFLDDNLVNSCDFNAVKVIPYSKFAEFVPKIITSETSTIGYDSMSCSQYFYEVYKNMTSEKTMVDLDGARSLVSQLKIIKNDTEIHGLRNAYV